jgi:hypothetical protein
MKKRQPNEVLAPRWTNDAIIAAARRLIGQYESIVGRDYILHHGLHFDDVYEKLIFPKFGIDLYEDEDLGVDAKGRKLLGRYDVKAKAAHLDRVIARDSDNPRRIFTCWHEVAGHGALQGAWLQNQLQQRHHHDFVEVTEVSLSPGAERVLERQANLFAAHVAAPDWLINYGINTTFRPRRRFLFIEPCVYWLDVNGLKVNKYVVDTDDLCGWIGSKISGFFGGLSAESIGYRIRELGWVDDRSAVELQLHRVAS